MILMEGQREVDGTDKAEVYLVMLVCDGREVGFETINPYLKLW